MIHGQKICLLISVGQALILICLLFVGKNFSQNSDSVACWSMKYWNEKSKYIKIKNFRKRELLTEHTLGRTRKFYFKIIIKGTYIFIYLGINRRKIKFLLSPHS